VSTEYPDTAPFQFISHPRLGGEQNVAGNFMSPGEAARGAHALTPLRKRLRNYVSKDPYCQAVNLYLPPLSSKEELKSIDCFHRKRCINSASTSLNPYKISLLLRE
jgi:hypothetical protein